MRILLALVLFVAFSISAYITFGDYSLGAILGMVTSLGTLLTVFFVPVRDTVDARVLSDTSQRVLKEVDESTLSQDKGLSLMFMDGVVELYRPFIWQNHLHGGISDHEGYDPKGTLLATRELEDLGFLEPYRNEGALRQWLRTEKQL